MDREMVIRQLLAYFGMSESTRGTPVEIKGVGRLALPGLFKALGHTQGAEIGVWEGDFSEKLLKGIPGLHMTCVDSWIPYANYLDHRRQHKLGAAYEIAKERLAPYEVTFIRAFSLPASEQVPDAALDFVYIDANHSFEHLVADIAAWTPKVRSGGIISGHDYFHAPRHLHIRVVEAVDGYTKAHDIDPWFLLGRRKVRPGEFHERERSWLWVKP